MANQVEVLESIRDLLSGKDATKGVPSSATKMTAAIDDEILDLTMMLNDDGSVTNLVEEQSQSAQAPATTETPKEKTMAKKDADKGQDVLDEIDKLLAGDDTPKSEPKAATEPDPFDNAAISDETVEIELATATAEESMEEETMEEPAKEESAEAISEELESLISDEAASSAKSAISDLIAKTGKPAAEPVQTTPAPSFRNGDTVEDLVMEGLKPMLKIWLDENLPALVERIVQQEIAKIIPR